MELGDYSPSVANNPAIIDALKRTMRKVRDAGLSPCKTELRRAEIFDGYLIQVEGKKVFEYFVTSQEIINEALMEKDSG